MIEVKEQQKNIKSYTIKGEGGAILTFTLTLDEPQSMCNFLDVLTAAVQVVQTAITKAGKDKP